MICVFDGSVPSLAVNGHTKNMDPVKKPVGIEAPFFFLTHGWTPRWDFWCSEINSTAFRSSLRGLTHFKCSLQWISTNYRLTDKHLQSILKISTAQLCDSRTHWRHQTPAAGIRVHLEKVGRTLSVDTFLNTRLPTWYYKWGCKQFER